MLGLTWRCVRAVVVVAGGLLGIAAWAWADPSGYPILRSAAYWEFVKASLVIVAIETPILALVGGWRWRTALGGVVAANILSTLFGGGYPGTMWPDLPPLLVLAIVVELGVLWPAGQSLNLLAPRRPVGRLVAAVVLMNLATCWVGPAYTYGPTHWDKARQTTCLHRLKLLALAVHMYAEDHDMVLPTAQTGDELRAALDPYLVGPGGKSWAEPHVYHCPGVMDRRQLLPTHADQVNYMLFPGLPRRLDAVDASTDAMDTVMLCDDAPRHHGWRNTAVLAAACWSLPEPEIQKRLSRALKGLPQTETKPAPVNSQSH